MWGCNWYFLRSNEEARFNSGTMQSNLTGGVEMQNVFLELGQSITIKASPDSEVYAAARRMVAAYFAEATECFDHLECCNIHVKASKGKGCDCPFGRFSGEIFALDKKLKEKGF